MTIIGAPENIRRFAAEAFIQPGEPYPDSPEESNARGIPILYFDLIVPSPPNKEHGGCNGEHAKGVVCWYHWNLENWGTKWGAYEHSHYELRWLKGHGPEATVEGRIDLVFETAWSQPTPIFLAIEKRWDLKVHAVTQDEGGFPDTEYGEPYDEEVIRKVTTFEFDTYLTVVEEPVAAE